MPGRNIRSEPECREQNAGPECQASGGYRDQLVRIGIATPSFRNDRLSGPRSPVPCSAQKRRIPTPVIDNPPNRIRKYARGKKRAKSFADNPSIFWIFKNESYICKKGYGFTSLPGVKGVGRVIRENLLFYLKGLLNRFCKPPVHTVPAVCRKIG